ncbi:MAG: efflux RND transporter periplasmic adaptor subunit [Candidatus Cloacimonetes bacterium]|nr:efflux RND transporter periplasmic adaptor subunit [Candidatus Cloacimonadota bacterium]
MKTSASKYTKRIARLTAIVGMILILPACTKSEVGKTTKKETIKPVKTFVVHDFLNKEMWEFPGTVKAHKEAVLSFQLDGNIAEISAKEGVSVKKGDVLAKLDDRDSQFKIDALKARLKDAKTELDRQKELFDQKVGTKNSYDRSLTAFQVVESEVNRGLKGLENTIIRAPFDGVVTKRYVDQFQEIGKNKKVLLLQDITKLDIEVNVHEKLMAGEDKRDRVKLTATFPSLPNKSFEAKIKEFETEADPNTMSYKVTLTMDNPSNHRILPGMSTVVNSYILNDDQSYVAIPSSALFSSSHSGFKVWVYENNKVKMRDVKVGETHGDLVTVLSGLQTKEIVVVAGVHSLYEGQKVKIYQEPLQ